MGPVLIANCHEALAKHLLLLYERKAPCQQEWEDEEQELDESELASTPTFTLYNLTLKNM